MNVPVENRYAEKLIADVPGNVLRGCDSLYAEKMIADVPGNILRGCDRFSASSGAPGGWGP